MTAAAASGLPSGRLLVGLLALTLSAGCASGADPNGAAPGRTDECLTGTLRASSTEVEEFLVLEGPEGPAVPLADRTEEGIRWLSGAELRVCGSRSAAGTLDVRSFELLTVDGATAHLGVVRQQGETLVLDPGGSLPAVVLLSPPARLLQAQGRTAWVTGRRTGDGLVVQAYGIRPEDG